MTDKELAEIEETINFWIIHINEPLTIVEAGRKLLAEVKRLRAELHPEPVEGLAAGRGKAVSGGYAQESDE